MAVRIGGPIALVVTLLVEFLTQVDGIGGLTAVLENYAFRHRPTP